MMTWKATGQPTVRRQRDKWVVRIDGIDTTTGKVRPKQIGTYASQRTAQAAARERNAEVRSLERGNVSWLVRRYVNGKIDITPKAREQYVWAIPHIERGLGGIPLNRLDRDDITRWIVALAGGGRLSKRSVQICRNVLRAALADVVDEGLIPRSPAARVPLPRTVAKPVKVIAFAPITHRGAGVRPTVRRRSGNRPSHDVSVRCNVIQRLTRGLVMHLMQRIFCGAVLFGTLVVLRPIPNASAVPAYVYKPVVTTTNSDTSEPILSANGRYVMYDYLNNLWLYDIMLGSTSQIGTSETGSAISADGRYILYVEPDPVIKNNLGFYPTPLYELFRLDRDTGERVQIDRAPDGGPANHSAAGLVTVSDDGATVVFASAATNLIVGQSDQCRMFVWNSAGPVIDCVAGTALAARVSGDAQSIVMALDQTPNGGLYPVQVRNLRTGVITAVGTGWTGMGDGPTISRDGRYVGFSEGIASEAVRYDLTSNTRTVASAGGGGTPVIAYNSYLSADGSKLVFRDLGMRVTQTFLYDFVSGTTSRVGNGPSGQDPDGEVAAAVVSADGSVIAFKTQATNLSPLDTSSVPVTGWRGLYVRITQASTTDVTPPVVSAVLPSGSTAGWYNAPVTVSWTVDDSTANVPAPFTVTGEGAGQVVTSAPSCDLAGNCATGSATVSVDSVKPIESVIGVSAGGVYRLGAVPTVTCSVDDGSPSSGLVIEPTATLAGGNADGSGSFTATCSGARDVAGNLALPATVSFIVHYVVSGGGIGGGGAGGPVNAPPVVNVGKAGRSYAAQWKLTNAAGIPITTLSAITSVTYKATACSTFTGDPADALEAEATGNSGLRLTGTTFAFNWKTPSTPGCYTLFVNTADGAVLNANFKLS
jgi:Tol biopolymer transport system component